MSDFIAVLAFIILMSISFASGSVLNNHGDTARNEIHKCESTLPRNQKCVVVITAVPEIEVEK